IGVPISKKKPGDEMTIATETGQIPKRNDTICGSPSLFPFIATERKSSKNEDFDGGSLFKGIHLKKSLKSVLKWRRWRRAHHPGLRHQHTPNSTPSVPHLPAKDQKTASDPQT